MMAKQNEQIIKFVYFIIQSKSKKISSMKEMTTLGIFLVLLCLMQTSLSASQQCSNPSYIIPYQPLNQIFDSGLSQVRAQQQLVDLLEDPSVETAKDYLLSLAPYSAPLFAMAGVTLVIFIATIIQVLCFNSCGKQCCGNQINDKTYNICCFRAFVAAFLILAFFVILMSIAGLILNSDLQQAVRYTTCNTQNIVFETYNGNTNQSMPWSGTNNFQNNIEIFSASIQNSIPYLISYFSNTTPSYNQVTDSTTGSPYANSQVFNCQNSNTTINCPFPASYQNCTTPYLATFNAQFCNASFNGSAASLIANEMSVNSTKWRNNTVGISQTLLSLNTDASSVEALNQSILSFTNSLGFYQTSIQQGFGSAQSIQWAIQVAFYSFYSLILATSLFSIVTLCMTYFCNNFKCRYFMYVYWYLFFFLSLLLFIDSGFFNATSIFAFDTCSAYPYYFGNYTNFQELVFNDTQLGSIFSTCYFTNKTTSMFSAFSNTTLLNQFGTLYSQYQNSIPSNQFSSVVSAIENQMVDYAANPNIVTIQNVNASQQPYMALYQLNIQANYTAPLSTQLCNLTHDYFTFNVANCGLYLTNQPIGSNCCIVLYSPNITTIVDGRVNEFTNKSCTIDANDYQARVDALISYGQSISSIALQIAPLSQSNTPLQNYQTAYYSYYSNVLNFYNPQTQQIFNSFFVPYVALEQGSGCPFITTSINGVVNITCDQLQPYINALSALNIACSVFVFILFILSYFLTTRLEFYEFLEGNFDNSDIINVRASSIQQKYELDSSSRNQELLTIRTGDLGNNQL